MSNMITERIMDLSNIESVIKSARPTESQTREEVITDIYKYLKNDSLSKDEISSAIIKHLERQRLNFPLRILDRLFNDSSRTKARDAIITIDFLNAMIGEKFGIPQNNKDIAIYIIKQYHDIHESINDPCQLTSYLISNLYDFCLDPASYHKAFNFKNAKLSTEHSDKLKIHITSEIDINIQDYPLKARTLIFQESDALKNPFAAGAMKEYLYGLKSHLEEDFKKITDIESNEKARIKEYETINIELKNCRTDFKQKLDDIFKSPIIDWENDEKLAKKLPDAIYDLSEHQITKNVIKFQAIRDEQQPARLEYYERIKDLRNKHKEKCIYAVEQTHAAHTTVVEQHLSLPLLSPAESKDLLSTFRLQLNQVGDNDKNSQLKLRIAQCQPTGHDTQISVREKLAITRNIVSELRRYIDSNIEDIESGIAGIKNFHDAVNKTGHAQANYLNKIKNIQDTLGPYDLSEYIDGRPLSSFSDRQIRGFQTAQWIYDTPDLLEPDELLAIKKNCVDYIKAFVSFTKDYTITGGKLQEIESTLCIENLNLINTEILRQYDSLLNPITQPYKFATPSIDFSQEKFNKLVENKRRISKTIGEALEKFAEAKVVLQKFDNSKDPPGILSLKEILEMDFDNMSDVVLSQYYENKVNFYLSKLGVIKPEDIIKNSIYVIPLSTQDLPQPEMVSDSILNTKK